MSFAAVVDTSTAIALARGGLFQYLGQVLEPLFIGRGAEIECRKDPVTSAALDMAQSASPSFPRVVTLIARSRVYDSRLSVEDIEGIELALDRSALLLTQDDIQTIEASKSGVQGVLHTFHLLEGFKMREVITHVRPILEQMERNGERHSKSDLNKLLRRMGESLIP